MAAVGDNASDLTDPELRLTAPIGDSNAFNLFYANKPIPPNNTTMHKMYSLLGFNNADSFFLKEAVSCG